MGVPVRFSADYDRSVDVLYLFLGEPQPVEGDGLPGGMELDYSLKSGALCGITVIGYAKNLWNEKFPELVAIVSERLDVDPVNASQEIERAIISQSVVHPGI